MSRVETGETEQYIVIKSERPKVDRRTVAAPERPSSLAGLLNETERLIKSEMNTEQSLIVLDTISKKFKEWFDAVRLEDKKKIGEDWGKAAQVTLDYGIHSNDVHTLWTFSWDRINATHRAGKWIYPNNRINECISDEEGWGADMDRQTGKVISFEYSSKRTLKHWSLRRGSYSNDSLRNRELGLKFDRKGNLTDVLYSENIALPSEIEGKGGEIMRTYKISSDISRRKEY